MMGAAAVFLARRDNADRLALQDRKMLIAKREDDVADIGVGVRAGQAVIALHYRFRRFGGGVEANRRLRGRRRRLRRAARAGMRLFQKRGDLIVQRFEAVARAGFDLDILLLRQFVPFVLVVQRVGLRHDAPFVDGACRAYRDAVHALIADVGVHDDIIVIVLNRVDRAGHLAGIAADADFRVDEVLFHRLVHQAALAVK